MVQVLREDGIINRCAEIKTFSKGKGCGSLHSTEKTVLKHNSSQHTDSADLCCFFSYVYTSLFKKRNIKQIRNEDKFLALLLSAS